jgi:hypothetical protein
MCVIIEGSGGDIEEAKGGDKQKAPKQKIFIWSVQSKKLCYSRGLR